MINAKESNVEDHRAGDADPSKAQQAIVAGSGASPLLGETLSSGEKP
jgi:hypothetical protein